MDLKNNIELMETFKEEAQGLIEEIRKDLCILNSQLRNNNYELRTVNSTATNSQLKILFELFRSAHTLKGTALCVGFHELGEVAAVITDIFRDAKDGKLKIKAEIISLLSEGVEACDKFLDEEEVAGHKKLLKRIKDLNRETYLKEIPD